MIPALLAAGTAIVGGLSSSSARQDALRQNEKAVKAWLDVNIPDPEAQKLALERFVQTGELTPELEEAVRRDETAFNQISLDPSTRDRQIRALDTLSDIGDMGMTPAEQAAMTDARIEIDSRDRGRREAIADSFARRGLAGSGVELTSQLANAQAAQDAEARMSRNVMADARKRALDAVIAGGDLAGDIRQFDYGMARDRATAEDTISDFNARMLTGTRQRNTDRRNEANRYNRDVAQSVADRNTALANDEMKWNRIGRFQQEFDNQAKVASGKANAFGGVADTMSKNAASDAQMWGNMAGAAGKVATAYGSRPASSGGKPSGEVRTGQATWDYAGKDDWDDDGRTA